MLHQVRKDIRSVYDPTTFKELEELYSKLLSLDPGMYRALDLYIHLRVFEAPIEGKGVSMKKTVGKIDGKGRKDSMSHYLFTSDVIDWLLWRGWYVVDPLGYEQVLRVAHDDIERLPQHPLVRLALWIARRWR